MSWGAVKEGLPSTAAQRGGSTPVCAGFQQRGSASLAFLSSRKKTNTRPYFHTSKATSRQQLHRQAHCHPGNQDKALCSCFMKSQGCCFRATASPVNEPGSLPGWCSSNTSRQQLLHACSSGAPLCRHRGSRKPQQPPDCCVALSFLGKLAPAPC